MTSRLQISATTFINQLQHLGDASDGVTSAQALAIDYLDKEPGKEPAAVQAAFTVAQSRMGSGLGNTLANALIPPARQRCKALDEAASFFLSTDIPPKVNIDGEDPSLNMRMRDAARCTYLDHHCPEFYAAHAAEDMGSLWEDYACMRQTPEGQLRHTLYRDTMAFVAGESDAPRAQPPPTRRKTLEKFAQQINPWGWDACKHSTWRADEFLAIMEHATADTGLEDLMKNCTLRRESSFMTRLGAAYKPAVQAYYQKATQDAARATKHTFDRSQA